MAVVETGTRENWTDWTADGESPRSITVPSDAEMLVMFWMLRWPWSTGWMTSTMCRFGVGEWFTDIEKTDEQDTDANIWAGYYVNPPTGAQSLTYDFVNDPDSGAQAGVIYLKELDTASPIRDSADELEDDTDVTGLVGVVAGDLMIGGVASYGSNITSVNDSSQTQLFLESQFNNVAMGVAKKDGASGFYYTGGAAQTAVAMAIAQAAGMQPQIDYRKKGSGDAFREVPLAA